MAHRGDLRQSGFRWTRHGIQTTRLLVESYAAPLFSVLTEIGLDPQAIVAMVEGQTVWAPPKGT